MNIKDFLLSSLAVALVTGGSPFACLAADAARDEGLNAHKENAIPMHVAGSYLSGQFAKANGKVDDAIRYLREVNQENPKDAGVAIQLQSMLLLQGRFDDAVKLADNINQSSVDANALTVLLSVLDAIKHDYPETAEALLQKAADGGSLQLWIPLVKGWVQLSEHKLAKPLAMDGFTADAGRTAPLVNYHLALINSQAGFKDEAAKNYKAAIEDPKDPPLRIMKMLLKFYEQNDAPEILTPLVKSYREAHPEVQNLAGAPVIASPKDGVAEILYTMGGIMFGAGAVNDAAIYLQLVLYVKPDMEEATITLGDAFSELQEYVSANENYGKIVPQSPFYVKAQLHIAVNYDRMGRSKDALALLDKLAAAMPKEPDILVTKGDLLRIHARFNEAVEAYSLALKRVPELRGEDWPILFARASCLERQGKWPEAEKDLRQALALQPNQPDVLNYLGFAQLERGKNVTEAREMIASAVKERPNDAEIVDSMGWVLYSQGNYQAASQYLEKAVELLPGDPTINDHLGDAYWRLGRKTEARFQWERSLTFSPESRLAGAIHRKLKEGLPPVASAASGEVSERLLQNNAAIPVVAATAGANLNRD